MTIGKTILWIGVCGGEFGPTLATRVFTLQLIYPYIGSWDPQHLHHAFIGLNESSPQVMNNGEMYQTQKSIFLFHTLHS